MFDACASRDELFRHPARRWLATGNGLFWCHSPTLCGMVSWGCSGAEDARRMLGVFEGYRHLASPFDILMDASAVTALDPGALATVINWWGRHAGDLAEHVRQRIAVIPSGMHGLALAGISPALGIRDEVTLLTDSRQAFRQLLPDRGDEVHDEVAKLIGRARGLSPSIIALRRALAEARGAIDLGAAGNKLGLSRRSLQRELAAAGTSFRAEQSDARFRAAEELLRTDDKLSAVATALGLALLVRSRTGLTPAELRRRLRGA